MKNKKHIKSTNFKNLRDMEDLEEDLMNIKKRKREFKFFNKG